MKYNTNGIKVMTFLTLPFAMQQVFETYIRKMKLEVDGEEGEDRPGENGTTIDGFWTWIAKHNDSKEFKLGGLYQTFIVVEKDTNRILATGTICPDDRNIKATYKLGGEGFWGGVNVLPSERNKGIGTFLAKYMDDHIQNWVNNYSPKGMQFHLFTTNSVAEHIYESLGFKRNALDIVHTVAFGNERLWTKNYKAAA